MSTQTLEYTASSSSFFARMGEWIANTFNAMAVAASRSEEIERLVNKSDDELAEMGLTREDIVAHVFRDKFYI